MFLSIVLISTRYLSQCTLYIFTPVWTLASNGLTLKIGIWIHILENRPGKERPLRVQIEIEIEVTGIGQEEAAVCISKLCCHGFSLLTDRTISKLSLFIGFSHFEDHFAVCILNWSIDLNLSPIQTLYWHRILQNQVS